LVVRDGEEEEDGARADAPTTTGDEDARKVVSRDASSGDFFFSQVLPPSARLYFQTNALAHPFPAPKTMPPAPD
jgi:hypothetical protein